MSLPYFDVTVSMSGAGIPKEFYKNNLQALINQEWENTTTRYDIEEEIEIGTGLFKTVDVKINSVVNDGITTGMKNGDDFRKVIFQDLNYTIKRGLYYKFSDNYWLSYFTDEYKKMTKDVLIRRCNNTLRWKDKEDGSIISYPCVVDYDVTSPSPLLDKDIITPNNHVSIIVQGNTDTRSIIVNQRFILDQRVYKITGYNMDLQHNLDDQVADILYLDAYLDTISPYDDFVNGVANNNEYNYSIKFNQSDFTQESGYTTTLTYSVYLDEQIVDKSVTWLTLNANATISNTGELTLIGESGSTAKIMIVLDENKNVTDVLTINIVDTLSTEKTIRISPLITTILQGRSVTLTADVYENNTVATDTVSVRVSGANEECYSLIDLGNNQFSLHNIRVSSIPLELTFYSDDLEETIEIILGGIF